ncbi:non-ribosomal peptide synthetase [Pseudoalteromonas sp. Of7M-16]|uniref:non-ribosomal peptide synthetase n=1 Tax=Pseudoalteromonas sp. Of7M-16 TaxID=2917756 RepID=UPI001EF64B7F|nr:non-ribosomal peptide synthetase [Pseudoalteromonas sp. Of7M-16]MCG7549005.1 amino acid adenylation domain-containing protein [Pseudoalteromonas sp. Of7M-16]
MENSAIKTLLAELDGQGIFLYVQDGRLKLRSRHSDIPAQKLALIKEHKQALIAYMQRHHQKLGKLSRSQQRIWFIEQYEAHLCAYNMAGLLRLSKAYSVEQVELAINTVLQRHDVLRSQFKQQGDEVVQLVNPDAKLILQQQDAPEADDFASVSSLIQDELAYQFDLEHDLLVRARLLVDHGQGHWLYVCMHHIVADGWSIRLFTQSLVDELAGLVSEPMSMQYLDFVHWENKYQQSDEYQQQLNYWQQKLAGFEVFELPTSRPRSVHKEYLGAHAEVLIPQPKAERFSALCQRLGVTQFAGFLGLFYLLLHRYGQAKDITLGVPVLNRIRPEFEGIVGCFINTLPLRLTLTEHLSLQQVLTATHELVKEGLQYQSVAVEEIIDALDIAKSTAHSALFQILFNYNGITGHTVGNDTVNSELFALDNHTAKFDLTLNVSDCAEGVQFSFDYAKHLFDPRFIEQLSEDYVALLDVACDSSQQVSSQVVLHSTATSLVSVPPLNGREQFSGTVLDALYQNAQEYSEHTALIEPSRSFDQQPTSVTYAALISQLEDVAARLHSRHQQTSTPITLLVNRSIQSFVWMLGAIRAGVAYLPIDDATPVARVAEIMAQADSQLLLCASEHLPDMQPLKNKGVDVLDTNALHELSFAQGLPAMPLNSDLAYVMFTSGSTGSPKGVVISHHALVNYVSGVSERIHFDQHTCSAVVTGLATDLGLTGIFPVLSGGGCVVLCDSVEPEQLVQTCVAHNVNLVKLTPSLANALLPWLQTSKPAISQWVLGGESLTGTLTQQLQSLNKEAKIFNHYGPTEACIGVCVYEVLEHREALCIPIGKPFKHVQFAVLDPQQQAVPKGVPGELYIAGDSLANEYINAPLETAKAFVSLPCDAERQSRYYRTGDCVKLNFDGQLEFVGRFDKQPKINGFRVDIAEIESKLQSLDDVQLAAVICREVAQQNTLVGYFVTNAMETDLAQCEQQIRQQLKACLPAYMIPAYLIHQPSLPKLSSGKIDRKQLQHRQLVVAVPTRQPESVLHHQLISIFASLTGCTGVGIDHSFFAIGGHSLLAMRLLNEIKAQCGVSLSLKQIFANPSVAELAMCIEAQDTSIDIAPLHHVPDQTQSPLSFAQQRIWFIDRMQGHSEQYNLQGVYKLAGELDHQRLECAFRSVIHGHTMLRFTFHQDEQGEAYQKDNIAREFSLHYQDISTLVTEDQQASIDKFIRADAQQSFDLGRDLMLRAALLRLNRNEHVLLITMHHIVSDGWSIAVLAEALSQAYQGGTEQCEQRPEHSYIDYIDWQQRLSQTELWQQSLNYWRDELKDLPQLHSLPTDRARQNNVIQGGELACFEIPRRLREDVGSFCQRTNSTLFQVLKTTFSLWMSRAQQQRDIVLATPVSGRELKAFEPLIGNFINTLVLRDIFTPETQFDAALAASKEQFLEAQAHQMVPFDVLVEALDVPRSLSIHPLAQVVFRVNNEVNEVLQLQGLDIQLLPQGPRSAKLDLEVSIIDGQQQCSIEWLYDTALWDSASIEAFHQQYLYILRQCIEQPSIALSQLALWDDDAQQKFVRATAPIELVDPTVSSWATQFSKIAAQLPNNTAISFAEQNWSYAKVEQIANQLAHCLLEMAFEPQTRIALALPAGPLVPIAMLGVLKANHVYVPLHHETPSQTLQHIFSDADVMLTLALSEDAERLIEAGSDFLLLDDALEQESLLSAYPSSAPSEADLPPCEEPIATQCCYIIYTSGSTGQPKGVPISHGNLHGYLHHAIRNYATMEPLTCVMSTPMAFDATVTAIVPTLVSGGELSILSQGATLITTLIDKLWSPRATLFKLTPAHLRAVLTLTSDAAICETGHRLIVGGEALSSDVVVKLKGKLPNIHIVNEYGPTETTVGVSVFEIPPSMPTDVLSETPDVPIGLPLDGVTMLVVDEFEQPAARNMPGELLIAGNMVSTGYLNQPELTASKFSRREIIRAHPQPVYRSGDRVKWRLDACQEPAYLRYLGRADEQIKLRGYRIDLEAIADIILDIEGIADCVLTVDDATQTLAAHIMWQDTPSMSERQLRHQLSEHLPGYMLPAVFNVVTVMPLTRNGKVDKAALMAALEFESQQNKDVDTASSTQQLQLTPSQQALLVLYQQILPATQIGLEDSFFELGGHSLLAIKLISQIRQQMQLDITLPQLFKTPSIAALAAALPKFERLTVDDDIPVVSRTKTLPLSFSQQRLWLIDQLQSGSAQYHMPASFTFTGDLDLTAFGAALRSVIQRHEVLRTIVLPGASGESPEQLVRDHVEVPLIVEDISALDPSEQQQREVHIKATLCQKPFDLSQDVMLRVVVVKRAQRAYWVHFNMHHIASDGWSMAVLVNEIIAFYRHHSGEDKFALEHHLTQPLAVQYADFAHWQRGFYTPQKQQAAINYWQSQLTDSPTLHQLPLDFARPKVQQLAGKQLTLRLDTATTQAIKAHCQNESVTLFMWLHSVFALLIMRYSGVNDVAIGSPVAGRDQRQLSDLIGFFVNTVVIRAQADHRLTFNQWLAQQKKVILDAFAHQSLPFEQVVEALKPQRSLSHQPLFQILFALQNNDVVDMALPDLHIEEECDDAPNMKFDLEVNATEQGKEIEIEWRYSSALFTEHTIKSMAEAYTVLVNAALSSSDQPVGRLAILTEDQKHKLTKKPEAACEYDVPVCLHERFENVAYMHKDRIAVTDAYGQSLNYGALWQRAGCFAHHLLENGISAGDKLAVCLPPNVDMTVTLLAVLRAGCAYVPVDPKLPAARMQYIMQDSGASGLITSDGLVRELANLSDSVAQSPLTLFSVSDSANWPETASQEGLPSPDVDALAYVIYTSGTTGQPKGVQISHQNLHYYLSYAIREYTNGALNRAVVSTPVAFDATVTSLWGGLLAGLGVELLEDNDTMLVELAKRLFGQESCLFKVTPAHLQGTLEVAKRLSLKRQFNAQHHVIVGGEVLPCSLLSELDTFLPEVQWVNEYGPTEATVGTSIYRCNSKTIAQLRAALVHDVPIGQGMPYSHCVVLDEFHQPVPAGVLGELYVSGKGVTAGYLGQSQLNQDKFVNLTLATSNREERFYRTGDKAKWQWEAASQSLQLIFCGRVDEQVKLRGYRIELSEISHHLKQQKGVREARVLLNDKRDNLEAYVVLDSMPNDVEQQPQLLDEVCSMTYSEGLALQLPAYMLPHRFIQVPHLPLTGNGKLDVARLHAWAQQCLETQSIIAPSTELESALHTIFAQVLNVETFGITDNFFTLGGHSLLAAQCVGLMQEQLNIAMPMQVLFERPTIAALTKWVRIHTAYEQTQRTDNESDSSEEMFL